MYYEQKHLAFWLIGSPDKEGQKLIDARPNGATEWDAFLLGQSIILPIILWIASGAIGNWLDNSTVGWVLGVTLMLISWTVIPYAFWQENRADKLWEKKLKHPRIVSFSDERLSQLNMAVYSAGMRLTDIGAQPYKLLADQFFVETELDAIELKNLSNRQEEHKSAEYARIRKEATDVVALMSLTHKELAALQP